MGWLERAAAIASLLTVLALAMAPPALGVGPTRGQYVEQVEPICKAGTLHNRAVLSGVEGMIRHGKSKRAAPRFARAAEALEDVVEKVASVPRPFDDRARLARWLHYAKTGEAVLREIGRDLRAEKRLQAENLVRRLLREAKRASATVAGFAFDYCRLQPARFV